MKALKIIGIALLAIVLIVAVVVVIQPSKAHIEQSVLINAPASAVFTQINSFQSFNQWSPWAKMDPNATYTMEGPAAGVGAKMSWDGKEVGKGSQWIIESVENERVKNGLQFEGFDGTFYAEIVLTTEGDGTKVTWTYDGDNSGFMAKGIWMMMSGMLDKQYQEGLQALKQIVESNPTPQEPVASDTIPE